MHDQGLYSMPPVTSCKWQATADTSHLCRVQGTRLSLLQVTRLSGKGTVAVACGHSYSAAVLADGSMYTWGTGLGGQLGLGPSVVSAVWPMRVTAGLESIRYG